MALYIHKEQPNKTIAEYFIITDIAVNKFDKSGIVKVNGYLNEAAREAAPNYPVVKKIFKVILDDVTNNIYSQAYTKLITAKEIGGITLLSTTPYFKDAINVL